METFIRSAFTNTIISHNYLKSWFFTRTLGHNMIFTDHPSKSFSRIGPLIPHRKSIFNSTAPLSFMSRFIPLISMVIPTQKRAGDCITIKERQVESQNK